MLYDRCPRAKACPPAPYLQSLDLAPANAPAADEVRIFDADVLVKRSEGWAGGNAVLIDRQPRAQFTKFAHCLKRHTLALHVEGANSSATMKYDGGKQDVIGSTIGQVMLIPASHHLEGFADYPSRVRHLLLTLDPHNFDDEDAADLAAQDLPYQPDFKDGTIAGQMRALQNEIDRPGPLSRLLVESLCCEIAIRSLRISTRQAPTRASGGLAPRRLRLVKEYIETNVSNEITLADLAAIANVSRSHFSRAFRASTGVGAHRYIVRQRIERAKKLLTGGKMPIAEIALAAGFGNQSHMTTHFRREVGTTPARFRNLA